jgi:hypothetical protein
MARFEGRTFRNERLTVEGNEYIGCNIDECVLVFSGDDAPSVMEHNIIGQQVTWTFEGAAGRTLAYLHAVYHGFGDGGREKVEEIFAAIRRSRPQGG